MSQWAQFLDRMATRAPGPKFNDLRWAAMRRTWSATSRQVYSRSLPPPRGWTKVTCAGTERSQW